MLRSRTASVILSTLAISTVALFAVPAAATAADGPPAYYPSGPQLNVEQADLEGWTLCYSGAFGEYGVPLYGAGGILSELCTGDFLLLAGAPVDSTELSLLAAAPRADVLFDTGMNDFATSHAANGSQWYFNGGWSWGFALGGDSVEKNNCDVADVNAQYRLCFHAAVQGSEEGEPEDIAALAVDETAVLDGGYRIGETTGLNGSFQYTRYIYQAFLDPAPAAPAPALADTGAEASTPLLIAGLLFASGLAIAAVGAARRRVSE